MKKIGFVVVILIGILALSTSFTHDKYMAPKNLPETAKAFLDKHFAGNRMVLVEKDIQFLDIEYEVTLADGTKINFDTKGEWKKIDCQCQPVPTSVLPQSIYNYVDNNFPHLSVVEISKGHRNIKVELSNRADLRFDKRGNVQSYED